MENVKSCCFIGHRKIDNCDLVFNQVERIVRNLIINYNVAIFNFGSKSQFDDICHAVVTQLQQTYSHIVRVNYHCASEYVVKRRKNKNWNKFTVVLQIKK